jgi:hypothetical protein
MVVADQVLAPLIVAANIASLGLTAPATEAGVAAKQTLVVGGKTIVGESRVGQALVRAVNLLQSVKPTGLAKGATIARRIFQARTGAPLSRVLTTGKFGRATVDAMTDFVKAFSDDFATQTSAAVNKSINDAFIPATARFLKETWGRQQLVELASANGWVIAQDVMAFAAIVDITGVTGLVNAYAKPICQDIISMPCVSASLNCSK